MIVLMGTLDAGSVWSDEYVLSIHICDGIKEVSYRRIFLAVVSAATSVCLDIWLHEVRKSDAAFSGTQNPNMIWES
jgi:hypothetical protein